MYFLPSPHILKHIKHPSKNLLLKDLSYGRHIFIMLKTLLMKDKKLIFKNSSYERQYHSYLAKKPIEHYMGKII